MKTSLLLKCDGIVTLFDSVLEMEKRDKTTSKICFNDIIRMSNAKPFDTVTKTGIKFTHYDNGIVKATFLKNGKYHRVDGPADMMFSKTRKCISATWFVNDHCVGFYRWAMNNEIDLTNLTPEDIAFIRMKWE